MGTVEYVIALEQQMELVALKRGWWVAFGGPRQPATASVSLGTPAGDGPAVQREPDEELEPLRPEPPLGGGRGRAQRAGSVPRPEPKRHRREPRPPSPRPMPDPAPSPVPDPPSTPDMPVPPRDSRGSRR